ncbi:hypothetical protein [Bradyrhizobium sp. 76]|jgi:hypothetical protein|uniref:hypothetical protein n=1 Tax=Bradyrhizobium sp. 76 TaxID=2782680 RepID=UPI001FF80F6E|nr:hypothetical protein [Bradyrhizobium sp. 76]MCK1409416.1 hypothetical protein [Bradyrhizobium sp. 76]
MGSDRYPIIKQWTTEDEKRLSEMVVRVFRRLKSQKHSIGRQRPFEAEPIG